MIRANLKTFLLVGLCSLLLSNHAFPATNVCQKLLQALASHLKYGTTKNKNLEQTPSENQVVSSGDIRFVGHSDPDSYAKYFAGMDNTNRQKIALTTALFPTEGTTVDMGVGSGRGTQDLAALNPRMQVIGVDLDPKVVTYANEHNKVPNAKFMPGNVAEKIFPDESVDGILDSSVLHEVATFTGFNVGKVKEALENQTKALKPDGIIVIRDFVAPENPNKKVYLDLPVNDGKATGEVPDLSTSALFEVFARDFKSSVHRSGGVPYKKMDSPKPGFVRYELDYRSANEFILRKDYRKTTENWNRELLEEYTYMTKQEFEDEFKKRGLRTLISKPIYNPWTVENRFRDKFYISDIDGTPLGTPPTNYLIVGQKIKGDRPIKVEEKSSKVVEKPNYLKMEHYRNSNTGEIYDLASRPDDVIDVVPWYEDRGTIYVLDRQQYPRPILNTKDSVPITSSKNSSYIVEPIGVVMTPHRSHEQNVAQILEEQGGLKESDIISLGKVTHYYPSPGGINERVHGQLVQVKPTHGRIPIPKERSGFSESGFVQPIEAQQALRSYQVGGMFDTRLEINIYNLLTSQGKSLGPWIGADVKLSDQSLIETAIKSAANVFSQKSGDTFQKTDHPSHFLEIREGVFTEKKSDGSDGKETTLEYVVPKNLSANTVSTLPVIKSHGKYYVGLESRNLPAPQIHEGNSAIITNPAFRLPKSIENTDSAKDYVQIKLKDSFGIEAKKVIPLGGEYFVSPGITPELVVPLAIEVDASKMAESGLSWISLEDLVQNRDKIKDAHLLTSTYRLAHALGILR